MRKIVASLFVSVDGVVEVPDVDRPLFQPGGGAGDRGGIRRL